MLAAKPDSPQRDAALYRSAWLLQAAGDHAKAEERFAELIRDFPKSRYAADAALRLAERRLSEKRYDDVDRLVASLVGPDAPAEVRQQALYLAARSAAAAGKWEQVETAAARLLADEPDNQVRLGAEYLAAEAKYQQGQFADAASQLAALADRTKASPQAWSATAELRRAQCLAQLRQWSEALEIAQTIATRFPGFDEQSEVDYLIGRAHAAQADFAAARKRMPA